MVGKVVKKIVVAQVVPPWDDVRLETDPSGSVPLQTGDLNGVTWLKGLGFRMQLWV